jgi:hypothetical protein
VVEELARQRARLVTSQALLDGDPGRGLHDAAKKLWMANGLTCVASMPLTARSLAEVLKLGTILRQALGDARGRG